MNTYAVTVSNADTMTPIPITDAVTKPARTLATGGQNSNPKDPVLATYGENWLKFRLRSHPDVAAIHHADLLAESSRADA